MKPSLVGVPYLSLSRGCMCLITVRPSKSPWSEGGTAAGSPACQCDTLALRDVWLTWLPPPSSASLGKPDWTLLWARQGRVLEGTGGACGAAPPSPRGAALWPLPQCAVWEGGEVTVRRADRHPSLGPAATAVWRGDSS